MTLDKLRPKKHEQEKSTEVDNLLLKRQSSRTHNVIHRAFFEASDNEVSGDRNRKKGAVEGAFDSLAMYIKTREKTSKLEKKLIEPSYQQQQHKKFGQQYEKEIKDVRKYVIQER